jgi:hypothetical protein
MSITVGSDNIELTRESYIELMDAACAQAGFTGFDCEVICEREETEFSVAVM